MHFWTKNQGFLAGTNYKMVLYQSKQKNTFYFSCILPHILIDAYSCTTLFKRLAVLYNNPLSVLDATPIDNTPISFEDITNNDSMSSQYWHKKLANKPTSLDFYKLFSQKQPHSVLSSSLCQYTYLPPEVFNKLKRLARTLRTTPFLIMMSIYALVLYRYTGQPEFSMLYPVNTRNKAQKKSFGYYVNLLLVQFEFTPSLTLTELIRQVTQQRKADKPHERYSYADIYNQTRQSQNKPFNVLFSTTELLPHFKLNDCEVTHVPLTHGHAGYGLSLLFDINDNYFAFCLEHDAHRFPKWLAKQLLEHIVHAIRVSEANLGICMLLIAKLHDQQAILWAV